MTEFALRHPLHHRADGVRQAACHDAAGHHVGQRQFERSRPVGCELLHDVALRHDADDAPVRAGDHQCADGVFGEKAGRSRKVLGGLDGQHIDALFRQNGFDGHVGSLPFGSLPVRPVCLTSFGPTRRERDRQRYSLTPRSGSVFLSGTRRREPAMRKGVNPSLHPKDLPIFSDMSAGLPRPARGAPGRMPRTAAGPRGSRRDAPPRPPPDWRRRSTASPGRTGD